MKTSPEKDHPISIQEGICISCGVCSTVCMFSVIIMNEETGFPVISPHAPPCNRCGHCVAYCPVSALHMQGDEGNTSSLPDRVMITQKDIRDLVLSRRSVRQYQKKKVPREVLENLFDIVRYAPSAMNLQTVSWQVIYETEDVRTIGSTIISWMSRIIDEQRLQEFVIGSSFPYITHEWKKGRDLITHGAPHLLITYARPEGYTAATDAVIATSYLDLIAPVFHLGTCWAGVIRLAAERSPEVLAAMDLPLDTLPQTALLIGYPALRPYTIPYRKPAFVRWKV